MSSRPILFDLDGTLVDSERDYAEAMARVLEAGQGIRVSEEERLYIIGRSWVDIYARLREAHPELGWSREELVERTAAEAQRILADDGVRVLPGAREAVSRFAPRPLALVTGSARIEVSHALDSLGLRAAFRTVVAAEDVSTSKPSPEGYLAAAEHLGVSPRECVVVEDSHAGIAAGVAAGARVVAVRAGNFAGHDQSAAHRVIDSLYELTDELLAGL